MTTPGSGASPLAAPADGLVSPGAAPSTPNVEVYFDAGVGALWSYLKPGAPFCFTPELLAELRLTQQLLAGGRELPVPGYRPGELRFHVMASRIPGVFSLGGDLGYFLELIRRGDRASLRAYAEEALDLVYSMSTGHGRDLTTISLVRGRAMGGGFEAAIAADVVVAERGAKMSFPEIMFNLFPGMGAYSLLRRRVSRAEAERLILSGSSWSAEKLHELGVVDMVAEPGGGEAAVRDYIRRNHPRVRGRAAWRRALEAAHPSSLAEMRAMLEVWVDTAMALEERDLANMELLRDSQQRFEPPGGTLLAG